MRKQLDERKTLVVTYGISGEKMRGSLQECQEFRDSRHFKCNWVYGRFSFYEADLLDSGEPSRDWA